MNDTEVIHPPLPNFVFESTKMKSQDLK